MGKIRNMHLKIPQIWQCNITHGCLKLFEKTIIWSSSASFICAKIFQLNLRKMRFLTKLSAFKMFMINAFRKNVTRLSSMIWKILHSDGANSQITLSKWCFHTMFHPLPESYRVTLNFCIHAVYKRIDSKIIKGYSILVNLHTCAICSRMWIKNNVNSSLWECSFQVRVSLLSIERT